MSFNFCFHFHFTNRMNISLFKGSQFDDHGCLYVCVHKIEKFDNKIGKKGVESWRIKKNKMIKRDLNVTFRKYY